MLTINDKIMNLHSVMIGDLSDIFLCQPVMDGSNNITRAQEKQLSTGRWEFASGCFFVLITIFLLFKFKTFLVTTFREI